MNIKKVGKVLLIGLMIISIPIWLIISEVEKSNLIFYTGYVLILAVITIGIITNKF